MAANAICLVSADAVTIQGKSCMLVVAQDATEHRRTETEVVAAIEAVMHDTSWFTGVVLGRLAELRRPAPADGKPTAELADLPARAHGVLALICRGLGNSEIAVALGISRNTVRNHVTALYRRTGVNSRAALVVWARERGFTGHPLRKATRKPREP